MLGMLALGFMLLALVAGVLVFQFMKLFWQVPLLLNLPGALFTGFSVLQFTGWISYSIFVDRIGPPAPDVPWYQWLAFLALAATWYSAVIAVLIAWRKNIDHEPRQPAQ